MQYALLANQIWFATSDHQPPSHDSIMARTKAKVRADHARARAGEQVVRRAISKQAARMMSVEEAEAAHLRSEVREPARDRACTLPP